MSDLHDDVFAISPDIRYVAAAHDQQVQMRSRPDLHNASSGDSDLYEELLVNPTLLTLATQRGTIDCGGLRYLIIGYGHFHQLVSPGPAGHLSVAFESRASPAGYPQAILGVMADPGSRTGLLSVADRNRHADLTSGTCQASAGYGTQQTTTAMRTTGHDTTAKIPSPLPRRRCRT